MRIYVRHTSEVKCSEYDKKENMIKKPQKRKIKRAKAPKNLVITYKDSSMLGRFVTEQGSLLTRDETGLSQKQQRRLAVEVKRARHLALLPFTQTL